MRLDELSKRLQTINELSAFPSLTIFAAGSFGRLEASKHSDLDLFFLVDSVDDLTERRTNELRIFGRLIEIADNLAFEKFSNDCEYLNLLPTDAMLKNLGGRHDDYENFFTARMLLLLEGQCLHGQAAFDRTISTIVESYFKDFPDHELTFQPTFLLNDICRFWKTLLLNYENKRGVASADPRRTKQRVRNFKLKFSRMTTCFASIAALGCHSVPVNRQQVVDITRMPPRNRLLLVKDRVPSAVQAVEDVLAEYAWFLEMTALTTEELEAHFDDKQKRCEMFDRANRYGDLVFELLRQIDQGNPQRRLVRMIVI